MLLQALDTLLGQFFVDFIFFCLASLYDISNFIFRWDIESFGSFMKTGTSFMECLQITRLGHLLHFVVGSVKDLSFAESRCQTYISRSCKQVRLDILIQEFLCSLSYNIQISRIFSTRRICFWESQLTFDFIWYKWQAFRPIVLYSSRSRYVKITADRMGIFADPTGN